MVAVPSNIVSHTNLKHMLKGKKDNGGKQKHAMTTEKIQTKQK